MLDVAAFMDPQQLEEAFPFVKYMWDAVADAVTLGAPMAGLLGAIYDYDLPQTGWTVKLPTEALFHVNGTPREAYGADIRLESADLRGENGEDLALNRALDVLAQARR